MSVTTSPISPTSLPAAEPTKFNFKAFSSLAKLRLSFLVVFSGAIAFTIGKHGNVGAFEVVMFSLGGFFNTISANIINQIFEIGPDSRMLRTKARPLPMGQISAQFAWLLSIGFGLLAIAIFWIFFNPLTVILGVASLVLYGFIYTPIKKISPLAVAIGAVPGAMPLLIGYVAATNKIDAFALILFVHQFIWQFPHFWSIAWVLDEDYARGGFRLLPGRGSSKDGPAAVLMLVYSLFLIPIGCLPYLVGLCTVNSAVISIAAGIGFTGYAVMFAARRDTASARKLMFASFFYLPIVQLVFLFCLA